MDNGSFVNLGALYTGQKDAYVASTPVTDTIDTEEVLLVASPEVTYTPGKNQIDFYNPSGKVARAYHLVAGDKIKLSDSMITGTTVVGQYCIPQNGSYKLAASATEGTSTRLAFVVTEKTTIGATGAAATRLRVTKA